MKPNILKKLFFFWKSFGCKLKKKIILLFIGTRCCFVCALKDPLRNTQQQYYNDKISEREIERCKLKYRFNIIHYS